MLLALNDAVLLKALGYLIGFLTLATLFAKWKTRYQATNSLRDQITAWWMLIPILWITLMFFPFSLWGLIGLIVFLSARELSSHWQVRASRLYVCLSLGATVLGLSFLLRFNGVSESAAQDIRWLFYLFLLTGANDVAQFISGKLLGKHKIAPRISPNKTWEGLLGGVVTSMGLSVLLGLALTKLAWPLLSALGAALALCGFAGDLFYSFIKRRLNIKDFSNLIRGHGGILDRVDSLVFTAPVLFIFLSTFIYPSS